MTSPTCYHRSNWYEKHSWLKLENQRLNGLENQVLQNFCKKWIKKFKIAQLILNLQIQNLKRTLNVSCSLCLKDCSFNIESTLSSTPRILYTLWHCISLCFYSKKHRRRVLLWIDSGLSLLIILLLRIIVYRTSLRESDH